MITRFFAFILIGLSISFISISEGQESKQIMILNMLNEPVLPRNFRTTKDPFKIENSQLPNRTGLDQLNISGSAQFSEASLGTIIKQLGNPKSLYIIDLRQESHGFLNGIAVSWYIPKNWGNKEKSLRQVEQEEKQLLQEALKQKNVTLNRIIKKNIPGALPEFIAMSLVVERTSIEQAVVAKYGLSYLRLGVTDHMRPTNETVDTFINFIRDLPKEKWIHIHCAAGVGRTTTFMAMYDMMKNAKQVSFNDIIRRQWLLGGLNLKTISEKHPWKRPYSLERIEFLQDFYEYCQTNIDNFQQSWSSYLLHNQKAA